VSRADRARRWVVVAAMAALFVLAMFVFVLPFAFPTPPPIVGRFQATLLFSPDGDGRRDEAKVNVRLRQPSVVTIEIQKDGKPVRRLLTGEARPTGWVREDFDGRDDAGRPLPDGTYAIKLRVRSGRKQFNTTRNIVIDTGAPRPALLAVASATLAGPGPGECRVTVRSRDAGSVVLEARAEGRREPLRRLGPRPVRADGTVRWNWDGTAAGGRPVPAGIYRIRASLFDAARNRVITARTCWVGRVAGDAIPGRPAPRDRVGVTLRRTDGTPLPASDIVGLVLRRRTAYPGRTDGDPLGPQVGPGARGPISTAAVTVPAGVNPAALWLVARTRDGIALIDLGGGD
jgi:hypothetical protein